MEQKNIEVQRKKGLNLMMKILITAIIPLIILVAFAGLAIRAVGVTVSDKLMQHELKTSVYAVNQTMSILSSGDWNTDGDQLYKGDYNFSEHQDVLDAFKENTGQDVTLSWNTTRMATSIVSQDGSREIGTEIAADVYQAVKEKGSYFVSDTVIDGQKYYGYYEGLYNSDGSMAGLVFTGMTSASVHEIYNDRLKKNIIFMVVLAIFACIFLAIVMMKIVKAMMSMIDHLDDVAEGNLDSKISDRMTSRSDEIGNIARALYSLIGGLAMIVKNIRTSAKSLDDFSARFQNSFTTINESIHNVNTAMEDIANGATNQAGEMENLTGSTEEMKEQNHKLDGTIKDLVEISDRTRESVDEVNRQTDRTNQSVMEIGSAIQMITDIASQTNLLSLNASIEAARAGEHGKGFAVVADEIRQLADQSSDSAKKIGDIVEELIKNSNKSVETMNGVLDEINEQNEKLSTTREAFDGLNTEVGNVVVAIDNIRREIETVNTAKNDVMSSMESLAAIAQENAASTEETSASMTELSGIVTDCNAQTKNLVDIAENLSDNVNQFRIKE